MSRSELVTVWFRDLPIRRKLVVITLASSSVALLLASGGFFTWDIVQYRSEIRRDLSVHARIIGENSAAPLTFSDERTAGETLAVLELRPLVKMACLYAADGAVFATYYHDGDTSCPAVPGDTIDIGWRTARLVAPVTLENRRIGTLLLQRSLDDVSERIAIGGAILTGLLVLAAVVAVVLGARMQRAIATPLLQLAETARAVSNTKDYSLRAVSRSNDEVGAVVQAFNEMLGRVQESTAELSRANRLKDEFLATLSHELRTPLNAVLGWTQVLRASKMPPTTEARALESIERNARAQARLIEDLLEISRIVTGKLRMHVAAVDLAVIIESAIEVVQPAAEAKRITLIKDMQSRPAMTAADPDRLQQVVWNLLSNAVKFTPIGGQVMVRLAHQDGFVVTVSDTGIGIDPIFLPHIFDPFRQADGSLAREYGGLGLGLAIVRQLVELHGGTVAAHSLGTGRGATFEVRLPSELPTESVKRSSKPMVVPTTAVQPHLLVGVDVLVVDDDEDARELLRTTLSSYGARVTAVASSAEATRALERSVPDVMVSDLGMPGEDGYALIRRVRSRPSAAGGLVPAIALTAYASDADREATRIAGYHAHVAKPFDPSELAQLIHQFARLRSPG